MFNFTINLENKDKTLYEQIYYFIKNEIQSGSIKTNTKLPSKRKLATHLDVSINTVDMAYQQLISEGYIRSVPKKGFYVCKITELFKIHKNEMISENGFPKNFNIKVDFSPSEIDISKFPFTIWRKILKNYYNEENMIGLNKLVSSQGIIELRDAISQYLHESRGVNCTTNQIIIGAGTDYLLQILSLLIDKKGTIVTENPLYNKAYRIFQSMGHDVKSISIDEMGLQIEPLYDINISAIYITPSHQFPLGISMPISRRTELLSLVYENAGCYIIEDDYDSEFRYKGKPIPSLQGIDSKDKVIYMGTFSRSIASFVRISYMVLPTDLLKKYLDNHSFLSCTVSPVEQRILSHFILNGYFERHLNKMRTLYKGKREHFVKELGIFGDNLNIMGENAGHHLLLKLKTNLSEKEMCERAYKYGVKVYGISNYFVGKTPCKYSPIVLAGYAGLDFDEISKGVQLLYRAWV